VAFGDLYLEEIRAYRLRTLEGTGLEAVFPVWGIPTDALAEQMLTGGLRARITCCDPRAVDRSLAGREWDRALLAELPDGVDPCGENGEFHTFCYAGPMFRRAIGVVAGECVERDGFCYGDLVEG
jgi:diphthamide synthase (EF-2-diphthine--ammonia ligase)